MDSFYLSNICSFYAECCISTEEAIKNGNYSEQDAKKNGYSSISVLKNENITSLLNKLCPKVIANMPKKGKQISAIAYASLFDANLGVFWQPASYVQKITKSDNALTFSIRQGCNSQLISLELLISYMHTNSHVNCTLSVSADHFEHPQFDRWNADYGIVYGDGCAASLVTKEEGDFKIVHIESRCCGQLEALHYLPNSIDENFSVRKSKKIYLEQHGTSALSECSLAELDGLVNRCLKKQHLTMNDIRWVILPNLGMGILKENYLKVLRVSYEKILFEPGRKIGHIGASDAFISLSYISENHLCKPEDKLLVIGAGAGFTWSCMLLEVSESFKSKKTS